MEVKNINHIFKIEKKSRIVQHFNRILNDSFVYTFTDSNDVVHKQVDTLNSDQLLTIVEQLSKDLKEAVQAIFLLLKMFVLCLSLFMEKCT